MWQSQTFFTVNKYVTKNVCSLNLFSHLSVLFFFIDSTYIKNIVTPEKHFCWEGWKSKINPLLSRFLQPVYMDKMCLYGGNTLSSTSSWVRKYLLENKILELNILCSRIWRSKDLNTLHNLHITCTSQKKFTFMQFSSKKLPQGNSFGNEHLVCKVHLTLISKCNSQLNLSNNKFENAILVYIRTVLKSLVVRYVKRSWMQLQCKTKILTWWVFHQGCQTGHHQCTLLY